MARISDLDWVDERMLVTISFPFDQTERVCKLTAEHLWLHQRNDQVYHGFRFNHEARQREQLSSLIHQYMEMPDGDNLVRVMVVDDGI